MLTLFSQPGLARQCRTRSVPPAQTSNANESSHASRPLRQSFGPRSSHVHCKVVDARYDQGSRALSKVTATPSPPGQSSAPPDQSKLFCRVGAPRCWATRLSPVSKKHRPTKLVYSLKDKGLIEQTSRFNKVFGIWDPRNKAIQLNLQAIWVSRLRRVRQKPLREVGALRLCVWLAGVMPLGPAQSSRPPGPPGSRRPSGRRGSRTVHPKAPQPCRAPAWAGSAGRASHAAGVAWQIEARLTQQQGEDIFREGQGHDETLAPRAIETELETV